MRRRQFSRIAMGLVLLTGGVATSAYLAFEVFDLGGVDLPAEQSVEVVRLNQGWSEAEARWYHQESQGTRILPLKWFLALERPTLNPWPSGLLASRDYLSRFGFLYDDSTIEKLPDLPIGFAIDENFFAPYAQPPAKTPTVMVGLTCAACHTGRLDVVDPETGKVRGLLVEGGSAMISLSRFQEAVGLSLAYTATFSDRFRRFARRVFGKDLRSDDSRLLELKAEVDAYLKVGLADRDYAKEHKLYPLEAGFCRTDALGLIGNRVFGVLGEENESVTDAPVNFPHLWDTSWFDWVQYNASIRMPMVRNIGEALGVGAAVNLQPDENGRPYASTVKVKSLKEMEELLGGKNAFEGLQPPRWDQSILGPLNKVRQSAGRELYARHCQECHYPPRQELKQLRDRAAEDHRHWEIDPESKKAILKLRVVDLNEVGTDPNQALNFYRRVAVVAAPRRLDRDFPRGSGSVETISAETGLYRITSYIRHREYENLGLLAPSGESKAQREAFNAEPSRMARRVLFDRFRSLPEPLVAGDPQAILDSKAEDLVIVAKLHYKARPLDGIWATPPFLHNGSVPSLYQMLVPVERRDSKFYLGSMRFDPVVVGYSTDQIPGGFLLDTSLPGNRNNGHEFRNLILEEFEAIFGLPWDGRSTRDERWAAVLALELETYQALTPEARWEKIRDASVVALRSPRRKGVKGVLGPEFREEERWQLVEFLKSL